MIRNNKLQGFLDRVNGDKRPITADIFLTDFCNEKCSYCRYAHTTGKYIAFEDFVKYAERLLSLGVKSFILTGGGEPSLNKDFFKIATYLETKGIPYGVNTNLVVMHKIHPKFMKVSLDAGDKFGYLKVRGVDKFDAVISNLKSYSKIKESTRLGVQCVVDSIETTSKFYNSIKDIDVDYIYFRPFENRVGIQTDKSVLDFIEKIEDKRIVRSFKFELMDFEPKDCLGNWSVITVNVDGNVPYCCHRHDDIVGSLYDDNILEKLKSHKINTKTCDKPCRLSGVNFYLENYQEEPDYCFL